MSRTRTLQDRYDRTETLNNITLFCLFVDCELVDFEEVVQDKRWRGAIDKEIRSIKKNDTWELRRVRFRYKEVINVDNKLLLVLMQQLFNSVTNYLNKLYCMKTCSCSLIWHFSRINHPYTNNVKIFYIVIQSHIIVYVKSDIGEDDFWFVDNVNFFIVVVPSY